MINKKIAVTATISFAITFAAVLVSSSFSDSLLIKQAKAADSTYSVTFDISNGALLENASTIKTVGAVTPTTSGEYALTLEYLNGTSLDNGLVSLSNGGYVALTTKVTNINTITVIGTGNGTLSFGGTQSYGYTDNFAIGVHYAEGANYFQIKATGDLKISSITVTYGCLTYDYETFSVLGTGGVTSVTNHGFTDSRSQLTEFYNGKLFLTTTAFNENYATKNYEISSTTMNILRYSNDKTSVEKVNPNFFNIDLYFGKLYLDFDTTVFNEGDILVLHKGSSFTANVNGVEHYFMLDNDFECTYSPLKNRLRSSDVNFTYTCDGTSTNNELAIFDGFVDLEGFDTSKRWTNYADSNQEQETGWHFNFESPVSIKTINLYHFVDGSISRIPTSLTVTLTTSSGEISYTVSTSMKSIGDFDNCTFMSNHASKSGSSIVLINPNPTIIANVNSTSISNYYKTKTNQTPKSEFYFHNEIMGVTEVSIETVAGIKTGTTPYCTGYFEIELLGK